MVLRHIMAVFVAWSKMCEKPLLSHAEVCERQWEKEHCTVQTNRPQDGIAALLPFFLACQFLHWGLVQCIKHILPRHVSICRLMSYCLQTWVNACTLPAAVPLHSVLVKVSESLFAVMLHAREQPIVILWWRSLFTMLQGQLGAKHQ